MPDPANCFTFCGNAIICFHNNFNVHTNYSPIWSMISTLKVKSIILNSFEWFSWGVGNQRLLLSKQNDADVELLTLWILELFWLVCEWILLRKGGINCWKTELFEKFRVFCVAEIVAANAPQVQLLQMNNEKTMRQTPFLLRSVIDALSSSLCHFTSNGAICR